MPKYRITSPDGRTFEVTAPDGATQEQVMAYVQKNAGQSNAAQQVANDPITQGAMNPAQDMSGAGQFAAGMGKAAYDIARGIGQFTPFVSRADIEETRKRDASLMNTGAGIAGNIAGNVVALAPTALIPGANTLAGASAIGAATGLMQPSTSTGETVKNTALGGVVAPAAILAGRGIAAAYQGAKGLVEPFTKAGQDRIAANVLRASATDPVKAIANLRAAGELVPGSAPTIGQAAKDPGLAQLERTFGNNPELAKPLQMRYEAQSNARMNALRDVAGTDDYYQAIKDGRSVFANEDYSKAMAQGIDQDMAKAMKPQIDSLMSRPSMKQAQSVARRLAAEGDKTITDFGSLEGLDWLKKALDNQISKATQPGSSIGKAELAALNQTKADLMATLEQIAPGYKMANDNFAAMSKQINTMDVARDLEGRLVRSKAAYGDAGQEYGKAYKNALADAVESVKSQTGMNLPLSSVMNTRDIYALENIAKDLSRKELAQISGGSQRSPTAQNMVSQNLLRRLLGPTGLPESWAEGTMLQTVARPFQWAAKTGEPRIQERLAELATNPQEAAALMEMARSLPISSRIGAATENYLPGASMVPLNALTANRQ